MKDNTKKRCITIILILIAVISLAAAFYVFQMTEEEYQFERAFEHWLDEVYGKRKSVLPSKPIMMIWLKRMAGIVIAAVSFGMAVFINVVKRDIFSGNGNGNRTCLNCGARLGMHDKFCPECGSPLRK